MPNANLADYRSTVRKPDDFDAFWEGVLQQAAAIPLAPEMVLDPLRTSEDVEVFQVFYSSLDHLRIAAWYCRPARQTEPGPAVLFLPGYQMDPPIPKEWARKGYCALSVAPRGKLRSLGQFNPGYPNLLTYNIVDRHTYAYRGFYVDAWRGVDFLLSRPEVDPARLGVTGSSQGGGLAITTAAMRREIRAAAAGAPYPFTGYPVTSARLGPRAPGPRSCPSRSRGRPRVGTLSLPGRPADTGGCVVPAAWPGRGCVPP
jgi:cephalosporin-C deacetylase